MGGYSGSRSGVNAALRDRVLMSINQIANNVGIPYREVQDDRSMTFSVWIGPVVMAEFRMMDERVEWRHYTRGKIDKGEEET